MGADQAVNDVECGNKRLFDIASPVCSASGFTLTGAEFIKNKDFGFSWRRSGKTLHLSIPDYMEDAPDNVLSQYVAGILLHLHGKKIVFGDDYMDYMKSDEFILSKRSLYLKRSRNLAGNEIGKYRNIFDSVQRLYDCGLLTESDIDNTVFTWTSKPNYTRLGYCCGLMRVVAISSVLDSPEFSDHIFDYVVYHECLHLRQGYRPFDHNPHDAEFRRGMKLFPGADEVEKELSRIPAMNPARKRKTVRRRR